MDKHYKLLYVVLLSLLATEWLILGLTAIAALIMLNLTFKTTFPGIPFSGRIILSSYCIIGAIALLSTFLVNFWLLRKLLSAENLKINKVILIIATIGMLIILVNSIKNIFSGWENLNYLRYIFLGEIFLQLGIFAIIFKKQSRRVF